MTCSRRAWLRLALSGATFLPWVGRGRLAWAQVPAASASASASASEAVGPSPIPLSDAGRSTLAAAAERVLPGALEAGVAPYIEGWLARRPFVTSLRPYFLKGLQLLEQLARKQGAAFASLPAEQQDALLRSFQQGQVVEGRFQGRVFFEHLVRLVLEGYLCDPRWGGNKNQVGWAFIGKHACWYAPHARARRTSKLPW